RAQKVAGIASDIPELEVDDPDGADLLVLSWGGTYGPVAAGVRRVRGDGGKVAHAHLHYVNPFPRNTGEVVSAYERVQIPEINIGQLRKLIQPSSWSTRPASTSSAACPSGRARCN